AEGDRAAAAYAASLLLVSLNEKEAAVLAEMEGLVTHLTSLVLVDEDGAMQTGLPAMRKIALPTPRTSMPAFSLGISHSAPLSSRARSCPAPTDSLPYIPREMGSWGLRGPKNAEPEDLPLPSWETEEPPTTE